MADPRRSTQGQASYPFWLEPSDRPAGFIPSNPAQRPWGGLMGVANRYLYPEAEAYQEERRKAYGDALLYGHFSQQAPADQPMAAKASLYRHFMNEALGEGLDPAEAKSAADVRMAALSRFVPELAIAQRQFQAMPAADPGSQGAAGLRGLPAGEEDVIPGQPAPASPALAAVLDRLRAGQAAKEQVDRMRMAREQGLPEGEVNAGRGIAGMTTGGGGGAGARAARGGAKPGAMGGLGVPEEGMRHAEVPGGMPVAPFTGNPQPPRERLQRAGQRRWSHLWKY
jgi:hypothetical protein